MNEDIIKQTTEILEKIQSSDLTETDMLKTVAICKLIEAEMKRIDEGGEVDGKAAKTFARIFDKFSAIFLEQGVSPDLCEAMNSVANGIRKYGD